jgi:predicted DCC family thiol-disulfide oxidoreductase YuxK
MRASEAVSAPAATGISMMHPVVLFDGFCNLCNASVRFIIDRDPQGVFRFASLQSEVAEGLLREHPEAASSDSIVLLEGSRCYTQSTAAVRIARRLSGGWPLLAVLRVVPTPVRDTIYRWIARNRYRWFGTRAHCRIPTPEEQARFLS